MGNPSLANSATRAKYTWLPGWPKQLLLHDHINIVSATDDELARVPSQPVPVPRRQRKHPLPKIIAAARKAGADRVVVDGTIMLSPAAAVPESSTVAAPDVN